MRQRWARALAMAVLAGVMAGGVRADKRTVISPDGTWRVAQGGMDRMPEAWDRTAPVPGLADMAVPALASVGVPSPERQAFWYRRTFAVDGPRRPVAVLKITKAQFGTTVWLNGHTVGEHLGCCTSGPFDVTEQLAYGAPNTLVVRIGADRDALPRWAPTNTDYEQVR